MASDTKKDIFEKKCAERVQASVLPCTSWFPDWWKVKFYGSGGVVKGRFDFRASRCVYSRIQDALWVSRNVSGLIQKSSRSERFPKLHGREPKYFESRSTESTNCLDPEKIDRSHSMSLYVFHMRLDHLLDIPRAVGAEQGTVPHYSFGIYV